MWNKIWRGRICLSRIGECVHLSTAVVLSPFWYQAEPSGEIWHMLGMRIGNCPECTNSFFPPKHILQPSEQRTVQQATCWSSCSRKITFIKGWTHSFYKKFSEEQKTRLTFLFLIMSLIPKCKADSRYIPRASLSVVETGRHQVWSVTFSYRRKLLGRPKSKPSYWMDRQTRSLAPGPALLPVNFISYAHNRQAVGGGVIPVITD